MERLLVVVVVLLVAGAIAAVAARRRPDAPTQPSYSVPAQLDRADFATPDSPWLVVVFTSRTCGSCAGVVERASALASDAVTVQEVESSSARDLHRRYGIDAVPMTVVADADGVVRASFLGVPTASDLWSTVADLRSGDGS